MTEVPLALFCLAATLAFQGYMGLINEFSLTSIMNRLYEDDITVEALRETFERDRPLHPISSRNPVLTALLEGLGYPTDGPAADGVAAE